MSFEGHGLYTIEKRENFFIIKYTGSWNEEAALVMLEDFKSIVDSSGFKKFGIISDLRQWEGSTPESLEVARKGLDYLYAKGQIASAHVSTSLISEKLAEPIHHIQEQRMHATLTKTVEEAVLWMQNILKEELH